MSSAAASKPAWVGLIEDQIKEDKNATTYAFSSLGSDGKPRNRFCIHRSITPTSSFLVLTTDTRMRKPQQLSHDSSVEIAWWIEKTAIQFRIIGDAYSIPPSTGDNDSEIAAVLEKLQPQGDEKEVKWWEEERIKQWGKMSGHLRASFGRPQPGKPLKDVSDPESWTESLPEKSDDPKIQKEIEAAQKHFSLIAIRPSSFECLELKPSPNKRNIYTKRDDGSWEKTALAP